MLGICHAVSNTPDRTWEPLCQHSKNDSLTVAQPGYVIGKGMLVAHRSFQPHPHTWFTIIVGTSFKNTMCKTCNVEYIAEKVKLDINKGEVVSGCRLTI